MAFIRVGVRAGHQLCGIFRQVAGYPIDKLFCVGRGYRVCLRQCKSMIIPKVFNVQVAKRVTGVRIYIVSTAALIRLSVWTSILKDS